MDRVVRVTAIALAVHSVVVAITVLGAIVVLSAIGLGALTYRAGSAAVRSGAALLLATFATLFGALATAQILSTGDIGLAQVTGVPLLVAGIATLVLSIRTIWRRRIRGGSRRARYGRRLGRGVAAFAVFMIVVLPLLLAVGLLWTPRLEVQHRALGHAYRDVSFATSDGLRLHGWYLPSHNGAAVIAFPGRNGPVPHARMLADHGYGVLLFDMRGTGDSDGHPNAFGWGVHRDLEAAASWLRHQPDVHGGRIGGLGLSVGGEQLLESAARSTAIKAVVSEGAGYRSMPEYMKGGGPTALAPSMAVLMGALDVLSSESPPRPLYDLIGRIAPRPVFLIEAGHGQGGEQLNSLYFRRAENPKQLWRIPEATHTGGIDVRSREYESRVIGFFDRYLLRAE